MLDNPSIPKSFHCKHNLWVTESVLGICQHARMELVKRFLQLPLGVTGLKSWELGRAGDAESAVEKPPAPALPLKLFCFHLGSEEIPAGITPESRAWPRAHPLPESSSPKTKKMLHPIPGAAFGLGAVWCLIMDLPPRGSQGSELFLWLLNSPLLMSCLSKTASAAP